MKKFVLVAAALILLTSSFVFAEPTHPNEVGLYTTPDAYGLTGTSLMYDPIYVYLVLTKPTRLLGDGEPYEAVTAFYFRLNFNPVPNDDLYYVGIF